MTQQLKTAALTIILASSAAWLPQKAMAQDAKIAVVDVQTLTLMSDEGKVIADRLEKRYQEISNEMQKAQKDIEDKDNRLRTQDRLMSATAKAQLAKEIDDAKIVFDRKNEDYQKELNELQNQLLAPVAAKAQEELKNLIDENGYTLVIDLSAEQGNVVWANPGNDITPEVMKRLNESFKRSGGAAAPAPAPASPQPATPPSTPRNTQ